MRASRTIRLLVALLTGLLPVAQAFAARVTIGCVDPATGQAVARHDCDMTGGRTGPVAAPAIVVPAIVVTPPAPSAHACCKTTAEPAPPPAPACDLPALSADTATLPPCCVLQPGTPGGDAVPVRLAPPAADRVLDALLPFLLPAFNDRPAARPLATRLADVPSDLRPPWRVLCDRCLAARPPPASR
ncbi:MAG TPA: hypothetical protein VF796_07630 [Humisphaera sp.]